MKFENVVNQYSNLAYKVAIDMLSSPDDAQDVVQDAYLSLYSHFKEYGKLSEKEIKNVLCRIVLNKCKDYLKSNKRKEITILEEESNLKWDSVDEFFQQEEENRIKNLINNLHSPYNELLSLYYIQEYSLDEIAKKKNTTKGTIKVQITRGKEKLKEILRKERSFMNKIEKIDQLLSDEKELDAYIENLEKQDVCVPKDLNKNILFKVQRHKNRYYMNICKIAACLIFGLAVCRTDFMMQDDFINYEEKQTISTRTEIQEKFSGVCSFLRTQINIEGKE